MSTVAAEVIDFVLPRLDDPIQVTFLAIIVLMMAFTIAGAHVAARPERWERKWNRGTASTDDDLDIEHGSVTDLWHAVATAPEKLAEIMPGLLLVVGLLGTFLGLGMALNHASNILGQTDAIANGMGDLLGLLKGLGTKFKTSTWGIMGFVSLRIWSEFFRFEEKRLTWVIDKVKAELKARNEREQAHLAARQQALLQQIEMVGSTVVTGLVSALASSSRDNAAFLQAQFDRLAVSLEKIEGQSAATRDSIHTFTEGTEQIVERMGQAALGMVNGAGQVATAAEGLQTVVGEFGTKFTGVLDDVGNRLDTVITEMSRKSAETLEKGADRLGAATDRISTSLTEMSADMRSSMDNVKDAIGKALKIQEDASVRFISSTDTFSTSLESTKLMFEGLAGPIQSGLRAVSDSSLRIKSFAEAFSKLDLVEVSKTFQVQTVVLEKLAGQLSVTGGVVADATPSQAIAEASGALPALGLPATMI